MIINKFILDDLTAAAKASPRLRMNLDLRNSPDDGSQWMLNAIETGECDDCSSGGGFLGDGGCAAGMLVGGVL